MQRLGEYASNREGNEYAMIERGLDMILSAVIFYTYGLTDLRSSDLIMDQIFLHVPLICLLYAWVCVLL